MKSCHISRILPIPAANQAISFSFRLSLQVSLLLPSHLTTVTFTFLQADNPLHSYIPDVNLPDPPPQPHSECPSDCTTPHFAFYPHIHFMVSTIILCSALSRSLIFTFHCHPCFRFPMYQHTVSTSSVEYKYIHAFFNVDYRCIHAINNVDYECIHALINVDYECIHALINKEYICIHALITVDMVHPQLVIELNKEYLRLLVSRKKTENLNRSNFDETSLVTN